MTSESKLFKANMVVDAHRVIPNGIVECREGRIVQVHTAAPDGVVVEDLGNVALVPGLINAHSHVFQRMFRGKTEYLDRDSEGDDFWSWRTQMYDAALSLTPETLYKVALRTYREMAATGITSVGEFHYVHHQPDGQPYDDANAMAHAVIRAAREVGLRIVLLRVLYHRAGFALPANPRQRRFIEQDIDVALRRVDDLRTHWAHDDAVTVGIAPHSVRAVPFEWFAPIVEYQQSTNVPVHIHVCEQRAEIAQSIAEYGKTPIGLLRDVGLLHPGTTLVHATHLSGHDIAMLGEHRPVVCACPSTERNLGDGFLPALQLLEQRVPICLGSDSHANIDLWDEMRLVEYHERLRYERRNVLAAAHNKWFDVAPQRLQVADLLLPMGTQHGGQSLCLDAGEFTPGALADLVSVSLEHWSIEGTGVQDVRSDLVFSLKPGAVEQVWVGGHAIR